MKKSSPASALSAKTSFAHCLVFVLVSEHLLGAGDGVRSWRGSGDEEKTSSRVQGGRNLSKFGWRYMLCSHGGAGTRSTRASGTSTSLESVYLSA